MDINDMSNLTLGELIPDGIINNNQLRLVLRALESKLLKIPSRVNLANKDLDFSSGSYEAIMCDVNEISTEMYEIAASLRESLPDHEQLHKKAYPSVCPTCGQ